ncbi:HAD-IIB family hydrolase [Halanaerobium saccharolyticum]|uniref:HAD-IIB family hydrolase n=1 Tax=Halanaerobium saccharolyticum TaxID=43595 RepID=UPI00106392FD|nr:HAD-IIB family hydrolase [Halanaerobium saccharolyticum]
MTDHWAQKESNITKTKPNIVEFEDLISVWKKGANKILCIGEAEEVSLLEQETKNCDLDNLTIYRSKPGYLEIIPQKASKRAAIKILQERFNINSSEIIAIGDNYNDIDMIKYVGLGVAMGNAPQKVKEIADQVTLSNDDEGVAKAIREYILD